MEIPSYIITWWAMDRFGRRSVLCLTMLLGGLACVSCMFVPESKCEPIVMTVKLQTYNFLNEIPADTVGPSLQALDYYSCSTMLRSCNQ